MMTQLLLRHLLQGLYLYLKILVFMLVGFFFVHQQINLGVLLIKSALKLVKLLLYVCLVFEVNFFFVWIILLHGCWFVGAERLQLSVKESDLLLKYALVGLNSQPKRIQVHPRDLCHDELLIPLLLNCF